MLCIAVDVGDASGVQEGTICTTFNRCVGELARWGAKTLSHATVAAKMAGSNDESIRESIARFASRRYLRVNNKTDDALALRSLP
jgi:hypothetical protein